MEQAAEGRKWRDRHARLFRRVRRILWLGRQEWDGLTISAITAVYAIVSLIGRPIATFAAIGSPIYIDLLMVELIIAAVIVHAGVALNSYRFIRVGWVVLVAGIGLHLLIQVTLVGVVVGGPWLSSIAFFAIVAQMNRARQRYASVHAMNELRNELRQMRTPEGSDD